MATHDRRTGHGSGHPIFKDGWSGGYLVLVLRANDMTAQAVLVTMGSEQQLGVPRALAAAALTATACACVLLRLVRGGGHRAASTCGAGKLSRRLRLTVAKHTVVGPEFDRESANTVLIWFSKCCFPRATPAEATIQ